MSWIVDGHKWVCYDMGTPILFPKKIMANWHGMYLPTDDEGSADLILPSGKFAMADGMDFDNPKTDTDRASAKRVKEKLSHHIETIEGGTGISFGTEGDWVTWWSEKNILVNDGYTYGHLPTEEILQSLEWKYPLEWEVTDGDLIIFPDTQHGGDPDLDMDDCFELNLEPGKYRVEYTYSEEAGQTLFRLIKI